MNGITSRYYAQDTQQNATESVYQLAAKAVVDCIEDADSDLGVTYFSGGSTYAPLAGPGLCSIVHGELSSLQAFKNPLEVSSHSGICTASAAALIGAIRAIKIGDHSCAIAMGAEHASDVLKSTRICPIDDRNDHADVRDSQWFMSVFLRFMLSDGAGAFLIQDKPNAHGLSLEVDWTYSLSMAHERPLCMKLDNRTGTLSQDVRILNRHLFPAIENFVHCALGHHNEQLDSYRYVLPHISSFFFQKKMERLLKQLSQSDSSQVSCWTNLQTKGNTGAASIYVMLDEFIKTNTLQNGERLLLFIPESGQFNFALISLTAILR